MAFSVMTLGESFAEEYARCREAMQRKADPYWAKQFGLPPSSSGLYGPEPGQDMWRCGCDRCEHRVDYWGRDQAEEAAHMHNAKEHGGKPEAKVYVANFWHCLRDYNSDSAY